MAKAKNKVLMLPDGWHARVDGKLHGPFNSRGAALAGKNTEEIRAKARNEAETKAALAGLLTLTEGE